MTSMMVGLEPGDELHTLTVALMINLALHNRCASQLLEGNNLQYLIECAFHHQSSIIMKVLRNASTHPNTKLLFIVSYILSSFVNTLIWGELWTLQVCSYTVTESANICVISQLNFPRKAKPKYKFFWKKFDSF